MRDISNWVSHGKKLPEITVPMYFSIIWFSPDSPDTLKRVDNMNLLRGKYEQKKIHTRIQIRGRIVGKAIWGLNF